VTPAPRLSVSTAHRVIERPDKWHLALAFHRLKTRPRLQLELRLKEEVRT